MSIHKGSYFLNLSDCESFIKENHKKFISKYLMPLNRLFELALAKKKKKSRTSLLHLTKTCSEPLFLIAFSGGTDTLSDSTTKVTFKVLMWINHI